MAMIALPNSSTSPFYHELFTIQHGLFIASYLYIYLYLLLLLMIYDIFINTLHRMSDLENGLIYGYLEYFVHQ